jgi:hypothetical protein
MYELSVFAIVGLGSLDIERERVFRGNVWIVGIGRTDWFLLNMSIIMATDDSCADLVERDV